MSWKNEALEATQKSNWKSESLENKPQPEEQKSKTAMDYLGLINPMNTLRGYEERIVQPLSEKFLGAKTGKEIAMKYGASDVPYAQALGFQPGETMKEYLPATSEALSTISPASVWGAGIDVVKDPLTVASEAFKLGASGLGLVKSGLASRQAAKSAVAAIPEVTEGTAASVNRLKAPPMSPTGEGSITGTFVGAEKPQSLAELRSWEPKASEMVSANRFKEVNEILPDLETKPLPYHFQQLDNPKAMKEMKLKFENLPTEDAKKIAAYNQQMVNEGTEKISELGKTLGDGKEISTTRAGNDLIGAVAKKYNDEKAALGPAFEALQKSTPISAKEAQDLKIAIAQNSKLAKLLTEDEIGNAVLSKNVPRSGISNQEYGVLKDVFDDMNDGMSFKDIQNTREYLRKQIDPANPAATSEISNVRSLLLDQLEEMSKTKDVKMRETFKRYAINERARDNIEKVIGGKLESLDKMFAANPEVTVDRIFSNPNYASVVKDYVGDETFNKLVAAKVQEGINGATGSVEGLQPHKLRTWIRRNEDFLNNYVPQDQSKRLSALADYTYQTKRFMDEVNPSGTAASAEKFLPKGFLGKIQSGGVMGLADAVVSKGAEALGRFTTNKKAEAYLDDLLSGYSAKDKVKIVKAIAEKNPALSLEMKGYLATRGLIGARGLLNQSNGEEQ